MFLPVHRNLLQTTGPRKTLPGPLQPGPELLPRGFSMSPDRLLRRCLSGVRWHRYDENNLRLLSSPLSSSIHRAFFFSVAGQLALRFCWEDAY